MSQTSGPQYLLNGFRLIFAPKTRRYIIIPLLLNTLLFIGLWYGGYQLTDTLIQWFHQAVPSWLQWLGFLFYFLYILCMMIITIYGYGILAVLIGSPFYGMLSEHIQAKLSNSSPPEVSYIAMITMIPKAISREIRKILYYIPWIILILICTFIPVLNLATTFMWFVFGVWVQAIQYIDYPFDNNQKSFTELKISLRQNKGLALSFGGMTLLFMMIPIVNIFTIPAAVAGATNMWVDHWQPEKSIPLNLNKRIDK